MRISSHVLFLYRAFGSKTFHHLPSAVILPLQMSSRSDSKPIVQVGCFSSALHLDAGAQGNLSFQKGKSFLGEAHLTNWAVSFVLSLFSHRATHKKTLPRPYPARLLNTRMDRVVSMIASRNR